MCLGVLLDSRLTFAPHIRRISGRCFYHLRQLRVVWKSLTVEAAKTMVHSFVVARCDYYNSDYYGASAVHIRPLQNVLNAAARLVLRKGTTDLRDVLHWLPVQQRTEYKVSQVPSLGSSTVSDRDVRPSLSNSAAMWFTVSSTRRFGGPTM